MDKIPPHSIEAEQAVLGAMLLSADAAHEAVALLQPGDFYNVKHRTVFEAIAALTAENTPVDLVSVAERLRAGGHLDNIGGAAYITALANAVPTAANVEHYAKIVREKAILRRVIAAAGNVIERAYAGDMQALDMAQEAFLGLEPPGAVDEVPTMHELLLEVYNVLEERAQKRSAVTGLSTGYSDLDNMTSGLQPGELMIVGGRPSMGKSALARNIAENAARAGAQVLVFSLEDTARNVVQRSLSRFSGVSNWDMRRGAIEAVESQQIAKAAEVLRRMPMRVCDRAGLTVADIRRICRKHSRQSGLGLVVVDYIQLLRPVRDANNRHLEVSESAQGLRALAKELNVPVLTVAQLSRSVEARNDKRPQMSDLKESGDLEQVADTILLLYRDEYYHPESSKRGIAEVLVVKNKNGPTGVCELAWDAETVTFRSLAKEEPPGR